MKIRDIKEPESFRENVFSNEFALNSDSWTIKQLDDYANYCKKATKCGKYCITQEKKFLFLKYYPALKEAKK